jgi:Mn2+/Fe2+ NRAMP family transporter
MQYARYVSVLKWLCLALFAYFGTVMVVHVPWGEAAWGLLVPTMSTSSEFWAMVVAILGTTISPYLFFWQASQEAEDIKAVPERKPLLRRPGQAADAFERIRLDTYVGMAFSNLVALAIIITTAATLHAAGITNIETSAQAAEALKPVAGSFAFTIFTLGIVGTGLLSVPVLAGSAAYALGETHRWRIGLDRQPMEAKAFYAAVALATMVGALINFSPINPIKALYWSAVINGVVAVPVMAIMMMMTANRKVMGKFIIAGPLRFIGWLATGVMAAAVLGMAVTEIH